MKWFHDRNRYGKVDNLDSGSNTDWTSYGEGVGFAAVVFVAFAVVCTLVISFMYCGACCRCCFRFLSKKTVPEGTCCTTLVPVFQLVVAV